MGKVNLFFETFPDPKIRERLVIRLKCGVQFKTLLGWSEPYSGIIDTGAHLSAIPSSVWKEEIAHKKKGEYVLYGLSKKEECALFGEIAEVILILVDEFGNQVGELSVDAFLAETDQIPLILGFSGLLDKVSLHFDYKQNLAYVEEQG